MWAGARRVSSNQFPGMQTLGLQAHFVVANFLALRIQQRIQRPLPLGVSSWARSVLDPNKGGEIEPEALRVLESQLEENVEDV